MRKFWAEHFAEQFEKKRDAYGQTKGSGERSGEIAPRFQGEDQVANAVSYASRERQEKNYEIGQPDTAVNTDGRQQKYGEPYRVEREELHVAPMISEQPGKLPLESGQIFFREVDTLHEDGEQVNWENFGGVICPPSCDPEKVGDDETQAEKGNRRAHEQDLRGDGNQDKERAQCAVAGGQDI